MWLEGIEGGVVLLEMGEITGNIGMMEIFETIHVNIIIKIETEGIPTGKKRSSLANNK